MVVSNICLFFTSNFGEDSHFDKYCFKGVGEKPPTSKPLLREIFHTNGTPHHFPYDKNPSFPLFHPPRPPLSRCSRWPQCLGEFTTMSLWFHFFLGEMMWRFVLFVLFVWFCFVLFCFVCWGGMMWYDVVFVFFCSVCLFVCLFVWMVTLSVE